MRVGRLENSTIFMDAICIVSEKLLLRITKILNFLSLKSLHPDQFLESSKSHNIDF